MVEDQVKVFSRVLREDERAFWQLVRYSSLSREQTRQILKVLVQRGELVSCTGGCGKYYPPQSKGDGACIRNTYFRAGEASLDTSWQLPSFLE